MTQAAQGWFSRGWTKVFGREDPEEREVRELQRQGSTIASLAHGVSTTMVILVSVATLITLGNSTLSEFIDTWKAGHPDFILGTALVILFALVISMDTAMLYGALIIRLLSSRMGNWKAMVLHWVVVSLTAVIEAMTYYAMVMKYEHPTSGLLFALAVARSVAAPGLSIYLMLARSLPVTATDILNIASLRSGITMLKEVSHLTGREDTPLNQKFAIFHAASILNLTDQNRMKNMILAVSINTDGSLGAPTVDAFPMYGVAMQAHAMREAVQQADASVVAAPSVSVIEDTTAKPQIQNVARSVITATDREQYMLLVDEQLKADPSASPSVVAATLGLPVPLVCQYMAKRMSRLRSA